MLYDITYNHGIMNPVTVDAIDETTARMLGVAAYRKNSTLQDDFDAEFLIASCDLASDQNKGYQTVI